MTSTFGITPVPRSAGKIVTTEVILAVNHRAEFVTKDVYVIRMNVLMQ